MTRLKIKQKSLLSSSKVILCRLVTDDYVLLWYCHDMFDLVNKINHLLELTAELITMKEKLLPMQKYTWRLLIPNKFVTNSRTKSCDTLKNKDYYYYNFLDHDHLNELRQQVGLVSVENKYQINNCVLCICEQDRGI